MRYQGRHRRRLSSMDLSLRSSRSLRIEALESRFAMSVSEADSISLTTYPANVFEPMNADSLRPSLVAPVVSDAGPPVSLQRAMDLSLDIDDMWDPFVHEMHQDDWQENPRESAEGFFIQPWWSPDLSLMVRQVDEGIRADADSGWYIEVSAKEVWQHWTNANADLLPHQEFHSWMTLPSDALSWELHVEYASSSESPWATLWLKPSVTVRDGTLPSSEGLAVHLGEIYSAPAKELNPSTESEPKATEEREFNAASQIISMRPRGMEIEHHDESTQVKDRSIPSRKCLMGANAHSGSYFAPKHIDPVHWDSRQDANDLNPQATVWVELPSVDDEALLSQSEKEAAEEAKEGHVAVGATALNTVAHRTVVSSEETAFRLSWCDVALRMNHASGQLLENAFEQTTALDRWLQNALKDWNQLAHCFFISSLPGRWVEGWQARIEELSMKDLKHLSVSKIVLCSAGIYVAALMMQDRKSRLSLRESSEVSEFKS